MVISSMMAFRLACKAVLQKGGRSQVQERLQAVPETLVDGLLERFTEAPRGHDS